MGIFDFLNKTNKQQDKSKDNTSEFKQTKDLQDTKKEHRDLLSRLKISPSDYTHENMVPVEINLSEELDGVIKISEVQNNNNDEFDYINLTEYDDGAKSITLWQINREERAIKDFVDKFSNEFGEDKSILRKKFTKYDLMDMEDKPKGQLREWQLAEFNIEIGYINNSNLQGHYIMVRTRK